MDNTPNLYRKLVAASRLITNVPKNGYNQHHKFHFATHDDVAAICKRAMDEVGLAFVPIGAVPEEAGKLTRVRVKYKIVCQDTGESEVIEWAGEGADSQDKALYKAMTQAKKTVLLNLFLIPTGDLEADGDYGHGYDEPKRSKAQSKPRPSTPQSPPADPREKQRPAYIAKILSLAAEHPQVRIKGVDLTDDGLRPLPMDTLESIGKQLRDYVSKYGEQTDDSADAT